MELTQIEGIQPTTHLQLDSVETSIQQHIPSCYNVYSTSKHINELVAVKGLYHALDSINSTHNEQNLDECRKFAWFVRHKDTGKVKVFANSCRLRWCPVCAAAKQYRIKHNVSQWIRTLRRPRLLTLTMSHSSKPLDTQIADLYKGFRLFRRHKLVKRKIRGGIWFFQLKKSNKNDLWHPHLHIVLDSDYISKFLLSQEWLVSTGNSYIIDIRAIKDPGKVANYVSRYCAKPCNMSDYSQTDRLQIATVLHGKRLCGSFGSGTKCNLAQKPFEDGAMWERLTTWNNCIVNRHHVSVFNQILKSYLLDRSIERSVCEHLIRENNADQMSLTLTIQTSKNVQYVFEEFVRR